LVILVLAQNNQPSRPSALPAQPQSNKPDQIPTEDFDDGLDLPQPRFSIAIDEGVVEDDSFSEAPPRLSMPLEEVEQTGRSIEIGRRAISEQPHGRLSRGSFGSIRASDRFGNISEVGLNDISQSVMDESTADKLLDVDMDADELGNLGEGSDLGSVLCRNLGWNGVDGFAAVILKT